MPNPAMTDQTKAAIKAAYGRFKHTLATIKHKHFQSVDTVQKEADNKFADSIKQKIASR
jgi:hypothetical protein